MDTPSSKNPLDWRRFVRLLWGRSLRGASSLEVLFLCWAGANPGAARERALLRFTSPNLCADPPLMVSQPVDNR